MKKVLMSLLIVCLTLCLLVGCNSDSVETLFKEKIEPTPEPPTPTTKTISVKEDDTLKFSFDISILPTTTWGGVIDVDLEDNWELSVNEKNGRLELTDGTTTYFVTTKLGNEFLKSTDTIDDTTIIFMVNPVDYTMKTGTEWFSTLTSNIQKTSITDIVFRDEVPTGDKVVDGKDLTQDGKGKVKGYIIKDGENYKIYVVGDYIFGNQNCSQMFYSFKNLTSLVLGNFDTSNVTNMSYMFSLCNGLTSLDLSKFVTSKVTNMSNMFSSCNGLTSLDLSKFDTSSVTDMSSMFRNCSKLETLDLSSFDITLTKNRESTPDTSEMFELVPNTIPIYVSKESDWSSSFSGWNLQVKN